MEGDESSKKLIHSRFSPTITVNVVVPSPSVDSPLRPRSHINDPSYSCGSEGVSTRGNQADLLAVVESDSRMDSRDSSKKIAYLFFYDFCLLAIVGLPIAGLKFFGKPSERGFFCDDETIRYPYKDSTVPNYLLYIFGFGIPIIVMVAVEYLTRRTENASSSVYVFGHRVPMIFIRCYKTIGIFLFGAACSQLTTDLAKYTIGRLRPHFIDVCKPDIVCSSQQNLYYYVTDYQCAGKASAIHDARLSFPSGHSSFSFYTMIYLALFIQARVNFSSSYLIKHVSQLVCILLAWFVALSRVMDNKHHWSDVLSGILIGTLYAIVTVFVFSNLYKGSSSVEKKNVDNVEL